MIWLVVLSLLLVFAAIGYFKGAIRMAVSLVGLFVALLLAQPLAPAMKPIYTASGMTNLIWLAVLPPITAFLLVGLIFVGVGFFVHYKLSQYYKFSADEVTRLTWERMNKRSGAALGLLVGGIYSILVGMMVYVAGYLTTQVSTESDTGALATLNSMAAGLEGSGLAKIARSISPVPEKYYKVSDILGMSHKTPLLEVRFRNYPPFLNLADDATIQEMASDDEYHNLLVQQSSLQEIYVHPVSQKIMSDQGLTDRLLATDLDDLKAYLETGESPQYVDELFLGRWELDANATINYFKKNTINVKARQIREMKEIVSEFLVGTSMIVYPDQSFTVTAPAPVEEEPEEPQADPNDPYAGFGGDPYGGLDPRYNIQPQQNQQPAQTQPRPQRAKPSFQLSGDGRWERKTRGRYDIQGWSHPGSVVVRKNHRAYVDFRGRTLVFKRVW